MTLDFFHYPETSGLNVTNNPYDGVHRLEDFENHDKQGMLDPEHLGHCIYTLRLALMCQHRENPVCLATRQGGEQEESLAKCNAHVYRPFLASPANDASIACSMKRISIMKLGERKGRLDCVGSRTSVARVVYLRGTKAGGETMYGRIPRDWIAMDERIGKGGGMDRHRNQGHG